MKKLKFYLPMLTLTGALCLVSPVTVHAEEEEILYEETEDNYTQEPIDDSKVENVKTTVGEDKKTPIIEEATEEKNDNAAINADKNQYLDNTNYYPETDPSENPGEYIPESVQDEVDRKLSKPEEPKTPEAPKNPEKPSKSNKPDESVPEIKEPPKEIPKMGMTQSDFNKDVLKTTAGVLIVVALWKLIKKGVLLSIRNSEEKEAIKVVASKESVLSKKEQKGQKRELTK